MAAPLDFIGFMLINLQEDIPGPVYRHSAVYFGNGCVLVSPGRTNSRETSTTFYIWSRKSSWRKCICSEFKMATALDHKANFYTFNSSTTFRYLWLNLFCDQRHHFLYSELRNPRRRNIPRCAHR